MDHLRLFFSRYKARKQARTGTRARHLDRKRFSMRPRLRTRLLISLPYAPLFTIVCIQALCVSLSEQSEPHTNKTHTHTGTNTHTNTVTNTNTHSNTVTAAFDVTK